MNKTRAAQTHAGACREETGSEAQPKVAAKRAKPAAKKPPSSAKPAAEARGQDAAEDRLRPRQDAAAKTPAKRAGQEDAGQEDAPPTPRHRQACRAEAPGGARPADQDARREDHRTQSQAPSPRPPPRSRPAPPPRAPASRPSTPQPAGHEALGRWRRPVPSMAQSMAPTAAKACNRHPSA